MFTVQHDNVRRSDPYWQIERGGHCILGSSDRGSLDPIGLIEWGSQIRGVNVSSDTVKAHI